MAKTWKCDGCGEQVSGDRAYLEFTKDEDRKYTGFRIIHNSGSCSAYRNVAGKVPYDTPLDFYLGESGLVRLLALIDPGRHKAPKANSSETSDWRGIVEIIRRICVPNYEEALAKMDSADSFQWPADHNEMSVYSQETLKALIDGEYDRE